MGFLGVHRLGIKHWEEFVIWLKETPHTPPTIRRFQQRSDKGQPRVLKVWATGSMTKTEEEEQKGAGRLDLGDSFLGGDRNMVRAICWGRFRGVLSRPPPGLENKGQLAGTWGTISHASPRMEGGTSLDLCSIFTAAGKFPGHDHLCLPSRTFLNTARSFPK